LPTGLKKSILGGSTL